MRDSRRPAGAMPLAGLALWALCLGCDPGPTAGVHPVHPVEGRVLFDGKPVAGAQVAFHPADEAKFGASIPRPIGETDAEGRFKLTTYDSDDGAPESDFLVGISGQARPRAESGNLLDAAKSAGKPDPLRGRFADPKTSGLKVTIKPGSNALEPFDLKATGGAALAVPSGGRGR